MKLIWKNFSRNKNITLAAVAAVSAMTLFLMLYMNSIRIYRQELTNTYTAMTVEGWVDGNKKGRAPVITQAEYTAIVDSGFIAEHSARITCSSLSSTGQWLYGLEDPRGEPNLAAELSYLQWQEGFDASLFGGDDPVCVAPRSTGLDLGDTVIFPLKRDSAEVLELAVVGLYGGGGGGIQNFYCPLASLRNAYQGAGLSFNYSGLNLIFADLANLETFKMAMLKEELHTGEAQLRIDDITMQQTTGQLKQQIALLEGLLPVLLVLVAAIGFGLSFLLLRGRKKEAAVLRSLGMRRSAVFTVLLGETALQAVIGCLLGCGLTLLLAGATAFAPDQLLLLWACDLLGGGVAAWKISGVNVFNIMTAKE